LDVQKSSLQLFFHPSEAPKARNAQNFSFASWAKAALFAMLARRIALQIITSFSVPVQN